MICISCPVGCHLIVASTRDRITVKGNQCKRGEIYGKEEMLSPKRIVTAVVKIRKKEYCYIPVKTEKPLLKKYIKPLLKELYRLEVDLPVKCGTVLIKNFENTGINVLITRSMKN